MPPFAMLATVTAAGLSLAILYNALMAQPSNQLAAGNGTTRLRVDAGKTGTTVQLRYDPVAENVQRELLAVGYYKGGIDGVVGRHTREAIVVYQRANNLEVTGEPSQDLIEHIRYTRQVAEASLFTGSVEPAPDAEQRARVRRVQAALSELSLYDGEINGELQDGTEAAIRQYERSRGLAETGAISDALVASLAKISGQSDNQ
jgi:peptidoglycan hydrolase-like protein with peptidoglycan-binding domain